MTHLGQPLADAVDGQQPQHLIMAATTFQAMWSPQLIDLRNSLPYPEGLAAASDTTADPDREQFWLHALLRDDGAVGVLSPATSPYGSADPVCISVNHHMGLLHQTLQLTSDLGRTHLGYTGAWNVGVYLQGLAGRPQRRRSATPSQVLAPRSSRPTPTAGRSA